MTAELSRIAALATLCCVFLAALGGGATYALYTDRVDVDVSISVADDVGDGSPAWRSVASVNAASNETERSGETETSDDTDISTLSNTTTTSKAPESTTTSEMAATPESDETTETATPSGNDSLVVDTNSEQSASALQRPSSDSP
ncbi:hypothetical protein AUR64_19175 [Haloprofundus marisrubri]|uniref:Uncharacterized protein n=1 Tax=Haloprofundus marisrubri TaxID=1514971 RepID=A0A0W1R4Y6_9EURY|nr:SipW-dependent-type signal peptide-containing protein [Haloprofundus marisrubri]KTG08356.1 hypothetical protein AUR64_19175 [Haloprofundus marisrubri]